MFDLKTPTDDRWIDAVLADFDTFLIDHAACERKASATGMSFVVRYPDRRELLDPLIEFAREELEHFHRVYRLCAERDLTLAGDDKDPYVSALLSSVRTGRDHRLLDRLLVSGIVEARGCERFGLVADAVGDRELQWFYRDIARSEARHRGLFLRLARFYFGDAEVAARADQLLEREAEIVRNLPLRAALH
ncbi:MAG: tRNA-(ms[2]io[6]A)-hydroxylase [Proteobacteria bacterium]|nr:tRNA-(ms[2]io[6]A)-hydroxylase [Pseudomonadota bacterium]